MQTIDTLLTTIQSQGKNIDAGKVREAYDFAALHHQGQKRLSGDDYITHPLAIAFILVDLNLDTETIVSGLLHDVVEDTDVDITQIRERFGPTVAEIVDGVTKIGKLKLVNKQELEAESLRKMMVAMSADIRVILVKLADRLHNMRTLSSQKEEKQKPIARETLDIYAPIAHRLGIFKIKWELEDLAFRYLEPEAYYDLVEKVSQKRQQRLGKIEKYISKIKERFDSEGIPAKIEGRPKHFYSIYRKMQKGKNFNEIYDLIAVRILVDTETQCYWGLGLVHTMWKPLPPGRVKDYIAMPKPNMYQSLHTTVIGDDGAPFEIQIRTYDMHRTAEYGIAAHYKYKEGKTSNSDDSFERRISWIRQLLEWQNELIDADVGEVAEIIKSDLVTDEIYVVSPKGRIVELPVGSCPIDFAYRIHSDVGHHCVGAKVNGKMVPLATKLTTGDQVEILTNKSSRGPSRDWLSIVKSSHAKAKIRSWYKKADREENIAKGKELLEKEAKRLHCPLSTFTQSKYSDFVFGRFTANSWEDIYSAIGYGGLRANFVLQRIIEQFKDDFSFLEKEETVKRRVHKNTQKDLSRSVIVKGYYDDDLMVRFAKCCTPVPGDKIIGYITKGRGISVHRSDCVNILNLAEEEKRDRLIEVFWADMEKECDDFCAQIEIYAANRHKLLSDISTLISNEGLSINAMNVTTDDDVAHFVLAVQLGSTKQLDSLIGKIKNIKDVLKVYRS